MKSECEQTLSSSLVKLDHSEDTAHPDLLSNFTSQHLQVGANTQKQSKAEILKVDRN